MSKKTTLANSTASPAPTPAKASAAQTIITILGKEAVRTDAAQRAAADVLARGMLAWLETQPDQVRAEIFVAVEATLSSADCRKIAIHPQRPQIDPARIEAARDEIAAREAEVAAEKQRATEEAKRLREEARLARQREKDAAERAKFEVLRAKFEPATGAHDEQADEA